MCIVFAMPELYGEDDKFNKIIFSLICCVFAYCLANVKARSVSIPCRDNICQREEQKRNYRRCRATGLQVNPFFPIVVA